MLINTFIHIQGIGPRTESDLWQSGIRDWHDFLENTPATVSPGRGAYIADALAESLDNSTDPNYFAKLLPAAQQWRIFPAFRKSTAYLDIETTGLSDYCEITTIALYDGATIKYYVQGENLDDFPADLAKYDVLVSYNGKSFDVPIIERYFGLTIDQAHLDLRYILYNLGFKGGLKGCEKQLGLSREGLDGVDGYQAVLLWNLYRRSGERRALETLLAYNIMDTVNLEALLVEAYNRNLGLTPFREELRLPPPVRPQIPFKPDPAILAELNNFPSPGFYRHR
ncbi:MAG: ribonuclease H-like domain-containing protein [Desulfurivibrionaceae bacterium]|nr:ribonuclease H-like domain-containing protein [Desulfobulbales bacterium]MDT8335577.1 ribonuclease H-like domain-containing protein [Desulfurivibrionaceae bacterium]